MNDSGPAKPLPRLQCDACKQPMRVVTSLPSTNGMRDLSYTCDQCGKITNVVHKPEDR
jgi:hypothetical protein